MNLIDKLKNNWTAWGGLTEEEKECFAKAKFLIEIKGINAFEDGYVLYEKKHVGSCIILRIPQDYQVPEEKTVKVDNCNQCPFYKMCKNTLRIDNVYGGLDCVKIWSNPSYFIDEAEEDC